MTTVQHDSLKSIIRSRCGAITGIREQDFDSAIDLLDLADRFKHLPGTVLLYSGGAMDCARYHILGVWPWLTITGGTNGVRLSSEREQAAVAAADPFAVLQACIHQLTPPARCRPEIPLVAGVLGYLAYDLKDWLEDLPRTSIDDLGLPAMLFFAHEILVVHDKQTRRTRLLIPERNNNTHRTDKILEQFNATLANPVSEAVASETSAPRLRSNFNRAQYERAVKRVIDYIAAGDVYQVNLSQRFETPFGEDGFTFFRRLFEENPAPFFAYIQAGDHQIVSTSPERFLMRRGRRVETRPIKGTRPRMPGPNEDAIMRNALTASAKEDAELSMIVDLLRNDIGKVCRPGSVRVVEHKRVETYSNVHHMVSIVTGLLDTDKDSVDLIRAAFPGGSITGCPKVRAMEIIDELETCRRHVYCGGIGYISFHDTMDLSIAIRTATIVGDTLRYSVGGGIVYDSTPGAEYEETLHKGQSLAKACRGGDKIDPVPMVWFDGCLLPVHDARIQVDDLGLQYGFGFFETIRADHGKAVLLQDHIKRFNKSWSALMPSAPPDLTWDAVINQVLVANNLDKGCAAIKLLVTRGSRLAPPWDHHLVVSARPYTHKLAAGKKRGISVIRYPHRRQTPLAVHKTLNYLYYFQAGQWAAAQGFDEALILNPDGTVSETNSANVLVITDRQVVRPQSPAVLPGVMSDAACRRLASWGYSIVDAPVMPEALLAADQVLATNALMGAVPVIALDKMMCAPDTKLWRRLNDAVFPDWRG